MAIFSFTSSWIRFWLSAFLAGAFCVTSFAEAKIWTGAVDTDWGEASNWYPASVPSVDAIVQIPNTLVSPVIGTGLSVKVGSVEIVEGAALSIESGAILGLGTDAGPALINRGTVRNKGSIIVSRSASSVTGFQNYHTFVNSGLIVIGGEGGGTIGGSGIAHYEGLFTNSITGTILIHASEWQGLFTSVGSVFNNAGRIEVGSSGYQSIGQIGLRTVGELNNTGEIEIQYSNWEFPAFVNEIGGFFTNTGLLEIGTTPNANIGLTGLVNIGTLSNEGEIVVTKVRTGFSSLFNSGEFTNESCGDLALEYRINNVQTFLNKGLLRISSELFNINQYTFVNQGIIEDILDSFNPDDVSINNEGVRVSPLLDTDSPIMPALDIGNSLYTITNNQFYLDTALTIPAGTYDMTDNSFTPSVAIMDSSWLFLGLIDLDEGCGLQVVSLQMKHVTSFIELPTTEVGITVFPNPVTEVLNVKLDSPTLSDGPLGVYDGSGRLVIEKAATINVGCNRYSIPVKDLEAGTYFLRIWDGERFWVKKFLKLGVACCP